MSQAVIVLFDLAGSRLDRKDFPEAATQANTVTLPFEQELGLTDSPMAWQWAWDETNDPPFEEWSHTAHVGLWRPGAEGLRLTMGRETGILSFQVSWPVFQLDNRVRELVRIIAKEMTRPFHSDFLVYLPDSGWASAERALTSVLEGADIQMIAGRLAEEIHELGSFDSPATEVLSTPALRFASHDYLPNYYLVDRCLS